MTKLMKSSAAYRRGRPFMVLAGICVVVALGLAVISATTDDVDGALIWPEVAKALISVLTVAGLGGVVKFLFDQHVREREESKLEAAFVTASIGEIEDIRSGIEHSRFLIMAHRSARSYRDQMQRMIELRVRTEALKRRIQLHWPPEPGDEARQVLSQFDDVANYLATLAQEYQDHYKPISDLQRVDEAVAEQEIKQFSIAVAGGTTSRSSPPTLTWRAWTSLTAPEEFPILDDLLNVGPNSRYELLVRPNCGKIVRFLTARLSIGQTRGVGSN